MKKTTFSGWFGAITPEEVEKAREATKDFEKKIAEFQRRPATPTTTDNTKEV